MPICFIYIFLIEWMGLSFILLFIEVSYLCLLSLELIIIGFSFYSSDRSEPLPVHVEKEGAEAKI